mmetsp:Transcript_7471/g.18692  ORF Transcript_7471/g.18692 Transcript_7471/m.18692 type:complete len:526 (+) Transcript_7471:200-1777(+)
MLSQRNNENGGDSNLIHVYSQDSVSNKRRRIAHEVEDGIVYAERRVSPVNRSGIGKHPVRRLHWARSSCLDDVKYADWKLHVQYFSDDYQNQVANQDDGLTIDVETTNIMTYSVHRSSLGVHSDYFEKIFLGGFSESRQGESNIHLPAPTVTLEDFEIVLEYCYTGMVDLNARHIISVLNLGDYFGIETLKSKAENFIQSQLHATSSHFHGGAKEKSICLALYYHQAQIMAMYDLQEAILHVCSKEPQLFTKDYALANIPNIDLWCRLWEIRTMHPDVESQLKTTVKNWSENLAYFFEKDPSLVTLDRFHTLTHTDSLPNISPKVAILLMEQEQRVYFEAMKTNPNLVNSQGADECLTSLQTRCIQALYDTQSGGWHFGIDSNLIRGRLRKLPPIVMESILLKSIEFEQSGQNFPHPVVSGAGSELVNGIYTMSGWFQNAMKFSKRVMFRGESRELVIYRYEGEWWISLIPQESEEPGNDDDIDIYCVAPSDEWDEECPFPPPKGWTDARGALPLPQVRLHSINH